ncbi:MAG: glycosyltransferase [Cyanobacteria bacterium J06560_6]
MKIAVFISHFPVVSQTFVLRHIIYLIDHGHEVDIYANYRSDEETSHPEIKEYKLISRTCFFPSLPTNKIFRFIDGLRVFFYCFCFSPKTAVRALNFFRYGRKAYSLKLLYWIVPFIKRRPKYDIIHGHFGPSGLQVAQLKSLNVISGKLVVSLYGYDVSRVVKEKGKHYYNDLWNTADLVLPLSEYMKSVIGELGCPSQKSKVHHLGVDVSKIVPSVREEKPHLLRLLSISRLVEKKGLQYSIEAVSKLIQEDAFVKIRYQIVGDGPLRAQLQEQIRSSNLEDVVDFLGWKDKNEISQLLQESDILLAPSVTAVDGDQEGTPVALMEAMSAGLPVLSTFHSGIPEIVENGASGFLVDERNADLLKEKLKTLIADHNLRIEMGKCGRKKIRDDYNLEKLDSHLTLMYRQLISTYI